MTAAKALVHSKLTGSIDACGSGSGGLKGEQRCPLDKSGTIRRIAWFVL